MSPSAWLQTKQIFTCWVPDDRAFRRESICCFNTFCHFSNSISTFACSWVTHCHKLIISSTASVTQWKRDILVQILVLILQITARWIQSLRPNANMWKNHTKEFLIAWNIIIKYTILHVKSMQLYLTAPPTRTGWPLQKTSRHRHKIMNICWPTVLPIFHKAKG